MKSETIELEFVNDLMTEAKCLGLSKLSGLLHVIWLDNVLAYMIALQVMNREFKYSNIEVIMLVEQQVMVTLIILDPNGTDLYAMIHSLFGVHIKFNDENSEILLKRMRSQCNIVKTIFKHIESPSVQNADLRKEC